MRKVWRSMRKVLVFNEEGLGVQQNRHINFPALVALKLLVSLISHLVACSARIVADRQTDRLL